MLAQLVFAGLIDVQDRMLYNRSYTTGHKAYRARSVVEIGNAIGWDNAHDVIYAGALDIAVGPRWHSVYEMACNVVTMFIEGAEVHAIPQGGTTERERALLTNTGDLSAGETDELVDALIRQHEPAYIEKISSLLLAGTSPRRIVDAIQLAAATGGARDRRPERVLDAAAHLRVLQLRSAGSTTISNTRSGSSCFTSPARWSIRRRGTRSTWAGSNRNRSTRPAGADRLTGAQIIGRLEDAMAAFDTAQSVAWTKAYLDSGEDHSPLVQRLALMATRFGNDPHNQEIPQCLLQDYGKNQCADRARLLLACAHISAGHRKYGDTFEASRRFGEAMGLAELH